MEAAITHPAGVDSKPDSRELWLSFRWSLPDEPRELRIFDLGNILEEALWIITSQSPPPSTYSDRSKLQAMSEQGQAVYRGEELPPRVNCRNCRHCCPVVKDNGVRWGCRRNRKYLGVVRQSNGCNFHNWIPELVPAEMAGIHDKADAVEYRTKKGAKFFNGPASVNHADVFSSAEIGSASRSGFGILDDSLFRGVRGEFGGTLVEGEGGKLPF